MKEFTENLDVAVFTTKYVIEQNSPILYVYHYEDGSWQFNGKENPVEEKDYRVVSLEEILKIDSTINELCDMPLGFEAVREKKNGNWKIISAN